MFGKIEPRMIIVKHSSYSTLHCDRTTCRRTRTSYMYCWCEHENPNLDNVAENLD